MKKVLVPGSKLGMTAGEWSKDNANINSLGFTMRRRFYPSAKRSRNPRKIRLIGD